MPHIVVDGISGWPDAYGQACRLLRAGRRRDSWSAMVVTVSLDSVEANSAATRITFALVATHNHFVLDRGGQCLQAVLLRLSSCPRPRPRIDHLATARRAQQLNRLFLAQAGEPRQRQTGAKVDGSTSAAWERFYRVHRRRSWSSSHFRLTLPLEFGRELDCLARRSKPLPARPSRDRWTRTHERIRGRMIALQEELDWDVYHRYGLLTDERSRWPDRGARDRSGSEAWAAGF